MLSVVFFQFIQDRFRDNEYGGTLITSILEVRKRFRKTVAFYTNVS